MKGRSEAWWKCNTGVEIAFRKPVFTWFAGLWLFGYQPDRNPIIAINNDPTTDLWVPFTPLLGVQIAPEAFPTLKELVVCTSVKVAITIKPFSWQLVMLSSPQMNIITTCTIASIAAHPATRSFSLATGPTRMQLTLSWAKSEMNISWSNSASAKPSMFKLAKQCWKVWKFPNLVDYTRPSICFKCEQ